MRTLKLIAKNFDKCLQKNFWNFIKLSDNIHSWKWNKRCLSSIKTGKSLGYDNSDINVMKNCFLMLCKQSAENLICP